MVDLLKKAKEVIEGAMVRRNGKIQKSTFTTTNLADGGLMVPAQSNKLIRMMKYAPTMLRDIRLVGMKSPTERVNRITFQNRILHKATEATALTSGNIATPTTSKLELSAQEFVAEVRLSYSALQDSVEGGKNVRGNAFENTIFQLMAEQLAIDLEDILLNSDTASATDDYTAFNGYLKLAKAANSYDHSAAVISKSFFKGTFLSLGKPYRRNKKALMWFIGPNTGVEWSDEQADRTTTTGDAVPWGDKEPSRAYGIPLREVGSMPEDSGASSNLGKVLLTHPKNAIAGIWRDIYIDVDKDIQKRELIIVASLRTCPQFEQVEGATVGYNVGIS